MKIEAGNPVSERKRTTISIRFRVIIKNALKMPVVWSGMLEALQITAQPGDARWEFNDTYPIYSHSSSTTALALV